MEDEQTVEGKKMELERCPEYERLNWTVVHGRGVIHTGHANNFVRTLATAGLVSGRESYHYMRYDDSPERDNIPMIFYAVVGNPDVDVVLHEEVEPIGEIFNAMVVLDSSMLVHLTSQRTLLLDGAKKDAVLVVNTSLTPDEIMKLVTKYSIAEEWHGKLVTVRARHYDTEIAYPLLGALIKAWDIVSLDDISAALDLLGKQNKADVVKKAYEDVEPTEARIEPAQAKTRTEESTIQPQPTRGQWWDWETYRAYKSSVAGARSYAERLKALPRWEALAPGLIEFGPLPGERNFGFKTSFSRYLRPMIDHRKCTDCKLCHLYCPDGAISFDKIEVDLDYCQGCGVCKQICPLRAITMLGELEDMEGLKEEETITIKETLREYGY